MISENRSQGFAFCNFLHDVFSDVCIKTSNEIAVIIRMNSEIFYLFRGVG